MDNRHSYRAIVGKWLSSLRLSPFARSCASISAKDLGKMTLVRKSYLGRDARNWNLSIPQQFFRTSNSDLEYEGIRRGSSRTSEASGEPRPGETSQVGEFFQPAGPVEIVFQVFSSDSELPRQ